MVADKGIFDCAICGRPSEVKIFDSITGDSGIFFAFHPVKFACLDFTVECNQNLAIIGPFLYLVVLSFSYGVFQNIPATRGGGDYTESPKVVLTFKQKPITSSIDSKYISPANDNMTIPLVLVEETSWAFYFADPTEAGGPAEWKGIGGRKPELFVVNKSEVTKLHAESRSPTKTKP